MEACGMAHRWARRLGSVGDNARLISTQLVRPDVKSNENDVADAEAMCEGVVGPCASFL